MTPRPAWAIVGLLGLWSCASEKGTPRASYESIILITVDTLRADHLSSYGYPIRTSPHLDALASRGALFSYAFSASSTTASSHVSIMTGLYPSANSVGAYNFGVLSPETVTLAEILKKHGYRTLAIVSNPALDRSLGLDQGFDRYDDDLQRKDAGQELWEQTADVAVDKAIHGLEAMGPDPFFLWLHIQDPHGPYSPPEQLIKPGSMGYPAPDMMLPAGDDHSGYAAIPKYQVHDDVRSRNDYIRRYDCEIAFADRELERLFRYMETRPRYSRTLLVLTADHGESLGEDGFYFSHSHSIGLDQVHVPLVMAGRGIRPGTRVREPVPNMMIFRTILSALGVGNQDPAALSLLDLVAAPGPKSIPPFYVESLNQIGLIYKDTFLRRDRVPESAKAFWDYGNPNTMSYWRPLGSERIDRLTETPVKTADIKDDIGRRLDAYQAKTPPIITPLERERRRSILFEKQAEKLRSLGYIR